MAKSLFAEETVIVSPLIGSGPKNDWVYTPNRGALRCVPPAPLSRLAGYALAVEREIRVKGERKESESRGKGE